MSGNLFIKPVAFLACFFLFLKSPKAQRPHLDINKVYVGEVGIGLGSANYYGDLNPHNSFKGIKMSGSIFYRYFFGEYFGASLHIDYAKLGFSDVYNKDYFRHTRNLSFSTDIWSFGLRGDFNFFKFSPGSRQYRFTPFLSLGAGIFHFNPYTYYEGNKYFLQPLGTEGQGSALYPDRHQYKLWTVGLPIEIGVKYNLNERWNVQLSASYFFTGTDYLDDVSTTYAGAEAFDPNGTGYQQVAAILQDRSYVYGTPIGVKGRQRGTATNKDQFVLIQIGISYLFTHYRCPF